MRSFLTEENRNRFVEWRLDFHAHQELAYEETRTAGIVAQHLQRCGYEVTAPVAFCAVN